MEFNKNNEEIKGDSREAKNKPSHFNQRITLSNGGEAYFAPGMSSELFKALQLKNPNMSEKVYDVKNDKIVTMRLKDIKF